MLSHDCLLPTPLNLNVNHIGTTLFIVLSVQSSYTSCSLAVTKCLFLFTVLVMEQSQRLKNVSHLCTHSTAVLSPECFHLVLCTMNVTEMEYY
jgi:hypothetical protein